MMMIYKQNTYFISGYIGIEYMVKRKCHTAGHFDHNGNYSRNVLPQYFCSSPVCLPELVYFQSIYFKLHKDFFSSLVLRML